jgi:hypothetical protein
LTSDLGPWLLRGLTHVLSTTGLHHVLFVAVLTVAFDPRYWRGVVVLVTGFTVAHGAVLAAVAADHVPDVGGWNDAVLVALIVAVAITNVAEELWRHRVHSPASVPRNAPSTVGALRASVREGPRSDAHFSWDGPLETGALRAWRYLLVVAFGTIHGLASVGAARPDVDAVGLWVVRVLAFDLGIEVGQWAVAAAVLAAAAWVAGRGDAAHRRWVWGLSGASALLALGGVAGGSG